MAKSARRGVEDFGASDIDRPTGLGHEWMDGAAADFSAAWTTGLSSRVTDTEDFADRLDTTARVFDDGTNAAAAEIDAMIWNS